MEPASPGRINLVSFITDRLRQLSPSGRQTLPAHFVLALSSAPQLMMVTYAPFLMTKTFQTDYWVPVLAATFHAGNILAVVFSNRVQRSDKLGWVLWPNCIAFCLSFLLLPVRPSMDAYFAVIVMLMQLSRAPVISALSALIKTNYRPAIRSWVMSMLVSAQMLAIGAYSFLAGQALEHSEQWLGPLYAVAGGIGLVGLWNFSRLRLRKEAAAAARPEPGTTRVSLWEQFCILGRDRGFRNFEVSFMLFGAGNLALATIFPLYLKAEFNASYEQAATALQTLPTLITFLMLPVWGMWLDRNNPLVMRFRINVLLMLVPIIYYFSRSMPAIYGGVLVTGLMQGGGMLIWILGVNYYARSRDIALYMGLHQSLTGMRGVTMPFIAYTLGSWLGYRQTMLVWAAMMGAGALILQREIGRERRLGILRNFEEREAQHQQADAREADAGKSRPVSPDEEASGDDAPFGR